MASPRGTKSGSLSGSAKARKARAAYQKYKKRSRAAKQGWETRRQPSNLFDTMVRQLTSYQAGKSKKNYSLFRMAKRMLYAADPVEAQGLAQDAAMMAGWDMASAMRFSKLS